ncbi:MAG: efflux RND transporter periplasmic adaptor subunit [Burkholderiaceae bacterium]|nr:efflux RND transporter periplasmic adaptor subunit [Burkholderiaceae bacterium]
MTTRALYIVVAAIGMAGSGLAAWWWQQPASPAKEAALRVAESGRAPAAAKPVSVEVVAVRSVTLRDEVQAVGSLRSRRSVVLRPEVSGRIAALNFRDGARVRQGQWLAQLDDQLPRAQVQQAQAELSIARANHQRNSELVAQGFISQRSLDESAANLEVAQAKLALAQATAARLRMVAPFDGIAGIGNVHVGDYLKDGTDIVNIEDIDGLLVDFRLPERYQSHVKLGQTVRISLDALPGNEYSAIVQALDPQIDANGRSLSVRASLDNRNGPLRPGMFARITLELGQRTGSRMVPEEAIVPQGNATTVWKFAPAADGKSGQVRRTPVQLGLRRDGWVEVTQGLEPDDRVVTAGQQRLQKDGAKVLVFVPAAAGKPS